MIQYQEDCTMRGHDTRYGGAYTQFHLKRVEERELILGIVPSRIHAVRVHGAVIGTSVLVVTGHEGPGGPEHVGRHGEHIVVHSATVDTADSHAEDEVATVEHHGGNLRSVARHTNRREEQHLVSKEVNSSKGCQNDNFRVTRKHSWVVNANQTAGFTAKMIQPRRADLVSVQV